MKKKFFFAALMGLAVSVLMVGCRRNKRTHRYCRPEWTIPSSITDSLQQCKAIDNNRHRCKTLTRFANGYCAMHQGLYKK